MSSDPALRPIDVPGRRKWRTVDLDRWLERRRQVRLRPAPAKAIAASVEARRRKRNASGEAASA
jgi:hypothetical protein